MLLLGALVPAVPRGRLDGALAHAGASKATSTMTAAEAELASHRVAILLRGQAFRTGTQSDGCNPKTVDHQLMQAKQFMMYVVEPLVRAGKKVRLVITVNNGACSLVPQLMNVYTNFTNFEPGTVRLIAADTVTVTPSQSAGILNTLKLFQAAAMKPQGGAWDRYAAIILARHDLTWHAPITKFLSAENLGRGFYFLSRCEPGATFNGADCINDALFAGGSSLFLKFWKHAIGEKDCFVDAAYEKAGDPPRTWRGQYHNNIGHGCLTWTQAAVGAENVHFLTDWRPDSRLREGLEKNPNPLADIDTLEDDVDD